MKEVWGFRPSGGGQVTSDGSKCEICGMVFKNISVLMGHMYQKHGVRDAIRQKIEGTCGCVCMHEFGSRERLVRHLQAKGSLLCRDFIVNNFVDLDGDVVKSVEETLSRAHH